MLGLCQRGRACFFLFIAIWLGSQLLAPVSSIASDLDPSTKKEFILRFKKDLNEQQRKNILEEFRANKLKASKQNELISDDSIQEPMSFCDRLEPYGVLDICEPNFEVETTDVPNDDKFELQKNLSQQNNADIDAPEAWEITTGANQYVVAVVDTGLDYTHPDIAPNAWVNPFEIPGNGIDDDGNGYVDDIHGINVITGSGDPMDDNGHGTHVAGIIGAKGNNGEGISGIAWNTKIIGVKFLDAGGGGGTFNAIKGIEYLIDLKHKGVNIVVANNSWAGLGKSTALENVIKEAYEAGILFVAAAGNSASNNDNIKFYPASYKVPNVISVAALDTSNNLAIFSNYGVGSVHIAAPGTLIVSAYPGGYYAYLSGTSQAAPHVSGAALLAKAAFPGASVSELKSRILTSAKPLSTLNGLVESARSLNLANLVSGVQNPALESPSTPDSTTPNAGAFTIYSEKKKVVGGKSYKIDIFGQDGDSGSLRFVINKNICQVTPFQIVSGKASVEVAIPNSRFKGKVSFQALNSSGFEEDKISLNLRVSKQRQNLLQTMHRNLRSTSTAKKKHVNRWCNKVSSQFIN